MFTMQELQHEIIQAEAKVNVLRAKLQLQKNAERLQIIISIKELIKLHQLSATDLGFVEKKASASKKLARIDKGVVVTPKYADPVTGKTWAGRGRTPGWLAKYMTAGKSQMDYLILNKNNNTA